MRSASGFTGADALVLEAAAPAFVAGLFKLLPLEASQSANFALWRVKHRFYKHVLFTITLKKNEGCRKEKKKSYLLSSAVSMENLYWLCVLVTGGLLTFLSVTGTFGLAL